MALLQLAVHAGSPSPGHLHYHQPARSMREAVVLIYVLLRFVDAGYYKIFADGNGSKSTKSKAQASARQHVMSRIEQTSQRARDMQQGTQKACLLLVVVDLLAVALRPRVGLRTTCAG